jgi:hypothetical protein
MNMKSAIIVVAHQLILIRYLRAYHVNIFQFVFVSLINESIGALMMSLMYCTVPYSSILHFILFLY